MPPVNGRRQVDAPAESCLAFRGRTTALFHLVGVLWVCNVVGWFPLASGFLPGVAPKDYAFGEKVDLFVNSLTSVRSQVPYRYYYLPFCPPEETVNEVENIGQILLGDTSESSMYELNMLEARSCVKLCERPLSKPDVYLFKKLLVDDYQVHWSVDNLPATMVTLSGVNVGFPLGSVVNDENGKDKKYYLNNYVEIKLKYHIAKTSPNKGGEKLRVVGFEVQPHSVDVKPGTSCIDYLISPRLDINDPAVKSISYYYDVSWEEDVEVTWAARWDVYINSLSADYPSVHWFSIINSVVIVLLLTVVVAMILLRILYRDIRAYNEVMMDEGEPEETGWKLVHGDVFRKPPHSTILTALTGSGVQVGGTMLLVLIFAIMGLFSPAYRGGLLQAILLLWTVMGAAAGYTAARFYKTFKSKNWKMTTLRTALLYPGLVFAIFFVLNLMLFAEGSSGAVPFGTMVTIVLLWVGVSTPLVFTGAYFGFKQEPISIPVRVNMIPRPIPSQAWFMHPVCAALVGGLLPFGAVFAELLFLFTSIWQHQYYFLFGFLLLVLVILVVTCSEVSFALVYSQLVCEDYNWWWRAFLTSSSSSVYIFIYCIYYWLAKLDLTRGTSVAIYLGYSFIISYTFFVLTGAVGFIACFVLLRKIYGSIKVD